MSGLYAAAHQLHASLQLAGDPVCILIDEPRILAELSEPGDQGEDGDAVPARVQTVFDLLDGCGPHARYSSLSF